MIAGGVAPGKIMVIHNAIDTDAWSPTRVPNDRREELHLDGASPVLGYVGRITPEKD